MRSIEQIVQSRVPKWIMQSTVLSAASHGLVTFFGLMPLPPFGLLGLTAYLWGGISWLWVVASFTTAVWYTDREIQQHRSLPPVSFSDFPGGRLWNFASVLDIVGAWLGFAVVVWVLL